MSTTTYLKSTVKLPSMRPPAEVPCTHCGTMHTQNTQHVILEHLGDVHYDACCTACEQILLNKITARLDAGQQRSFQIMLARKITNQQEEIGDLKQLISEWRMLVSDISRIRTTMKIAVWRATRDELLARTVLAMKERK